MPLIFLLSFVCTSCKIIPLTYLEAQAGDIDLEQMNSHQMMRWGSTYYLFSVSRRGQRPYFEGPWVELRSEAVSGLNITIEAPNDTLRDIQTFLKTERPECETAEKILKNSIALSQRLLDEWSPGQERPTVVIRLLPVNQGATYVEKTSSPSISGSKLYLLSPISSGENCNNLLIWSYGIGKTVIHELSHIYAYQRYGFWFNKLDNEYMASATEFCFQFAYLGLIREYVVQTRGLDIDRKKILTDPVLREALDSRRIGHSLAGKIIADALKGNALVGPGGNGNGILTEKDIPASNEICRRLHSRKPDLDDPEFIRYVYGLP